MVAVYLQALVVFDEFTNRWGDLPAVLESRCMTVSMHTDGIVVMFSLGGWPSDCCCAPGWQCSDVDGGGGGAGEKTPEQLTNINTDVHNLQCKLCLEVVVIACRLLQVGYATAPQCFRSHNTSVDCLEPCMQTS
jgi:hypothetical protein